MSRPIITFFDAKPYDVNSFEKTGEGFDFDFRFIETRLSPLTVDLAAGSKAVCLFVNDKVDKTVADRLVDMGVEIIALRCAGFNNINAKALNGRIPVVRVPAYSPHAVAEHALALLMSLNRRIHRAYNRTREANFSINGLLGFDLYGKTMGVIGTGQIGRIAAEIFRGLGMKVLAYDPFPNEDWAKKQNIEYKSLDDLLAASKVVSLHCPLNKETHHMLDKKAFEKMPDGAIVINTGRGALIHTQHLIDALKSGHLGGAGLDVYEEETDFFFEDHSSDIIRDEVLVRLLTFPNVLVTSHQAFFTEEAMHNIADTSLNNLKLHFEEKAYPNIVKF